MLPNAAGGDNGHLSPHVNPRNNIQRITAGNDIREGDEIIVEDVTEEEDAYKNGNDLNNGEPIVELFPTTYINDNLHNTQTNLQTKNGLRPTNTNTNNNTQNELFNYGDELMAGMDDIHELLILHLNTNGLGKEKWKAKNDCLKRFMRKYDFDIMGLTEINLHWLLLPHKDQWDKRSLGWWETGLHSTKAYSQEYESPTATQLGGCMLLSTNKAKWKIISNGRDFRNLGIWAWTQYRGKDEVTLRVILAYRCGSNSGPTTVFSQQHSYFDKLDDVRHPRDIMLQELCDEIVK